MMVCCQARLESNMAHCHQSFHNEFSEVNKNCYYKTHCAPLTSENWSRCCNTKQIFHILVRQHDNGINQMQTAFRRWRFLVLVQTGWVLRWQELSVCGIYVVVICSWHREQLIRGMTVRPAILAFYSYTNIIWYRTVREYIAQLKISHGFSLTVFFCIDTELAFTIAIISE